MEIGYARVSTFDHNLNWQVDQLQGQGCECIFQEKKISSKKERFELDKLLDQLRSGDVVIITELARLNRCKRFIRIG